MANSRVLVVDDDVHVRRTLHVALHANGYDVEEVGTGQAAIERTNADPADLVILDLGLPDIDGVEVCRELRRWSDLPIIVLSAAGDDAAKVRALDEGADDYVTKP
ncbi:MAG TPA: response regulator, partial [Chloroflexota bacterium]